MDAGRLDQRVRIETLVVDIDELGAQTSSWLFESNPWAGVMETPGREFIAGDYRAEEKVAFVLRWRDIDSTARVTWNGRVYRINSVTGTRHSGFCWLHCIATDGEN